MLTGDRGDGNSTEQWDWVGIALKARTGAQSAQVGTQSQEGSILALGEKRLGQDLKWPGRVSLARARNVPPVEAPQGQSRGHPGQALRASLMRVERRGGENGGTGAPGSSVAPAGLAAGIEANIPVTYGIGSQRGDESTGCQFIGQSPVHSVLVARR